MQDLSGKRSEKACHRALRIWKLYQLAKRFASLDCATIKGRDGDCRYGYRGHQWSNGHHMSEYVRVKQVKQVAKKHHQTRKSNKSNMQELTTLSGSRPSATLEGLRRPHRFRDADPTLRRVGGQVGTTFRHIPKRSDVNKIQQDSTGRKALQSFKLFKLSQDLSDRPLRSFLRILCGFCQILGSEPHDPSFCSVFQHVTLVKKPQSKEGRRNRQGFGTMELEKC